MEGFILVLMLFTFGMFVLALGAMVAFCAMACIYDWIERWLHDIHSK